MLPIYLMPFNSPLRFYRMLVEKNAGIVSLLFQFSFEILLSSFLKPKDVDELTFNSPLRFYGYMTKEAYEAKLSFQFSFEILLAP